MIKQLLEAFERSRRKIGEVPFLTSEKSPETLKFIKKVSSETGIPEKEFIDKIEERVEESKDLVSKSKILHETMGKNIVESAIFSVLMKHEKETTVKSAPRFDQPTFNRLVNAIESEHEDLFPLHNVFSRKPLLNPNVIITPDRRFPDYDSIDTACATPDGVFAFNRKFMQDLLNYAHLKNIKPKGKKYKSNGGKFPDEYSYIEFVILHEFMHYLYGDFEHAKQKGLDPVIQNYSTDYRSNYILVKSGYEQLPIGLFSDYVNYDRQVTHKEMYDVVVEELKKMKKEDLDKLSNMMNDGHEKGHSSAEKRKSESPSDAEIDKKIQDIEDKFEKNGKNAQEKAGETDKNANQVGKSDKKGEGKSQASSQKASEFNPENVTPRFRWDQILKKVITQAASNTEETYRVPSRRSATGAHVLSQVGKSVLKPGEVEDPEKLKIGFIIDSSGSMTGVIPKVFANVKNLLRSAGKLDDSVIYGRFSGDHEFFKLSLKKGIAQPIDVKTMKKKDGSEKTVDSLFKEHIGSSTLFSSGLESDSKKLISEGYSLILVSDSDILGQDNWERVKRIISSHKGQFFLILDNKSTFTRFVSENKTLSDNVTYFV